MRPARFETFLHGLLQQVSAQVTGVQTVKDAGYDRHPFGLVVTYAGGAAALLQIVATTAPGDRYDEPERIVEGEAAPAEVPVPELVEGGRLRADRVDEHLAALVLNSHSREVEDVEVFSRRAQPGAVKYGTRVTFHSGATIFVYVVHVRPAGRSEWPAGREFDVPAAV